MKAEQVRILDVKKKLDRRFEDNFNKWREYDLLTCMIAIVGLALAIVDWEYTRISASRIALDYSTYCKDRNTEECNKAIS